MKSGYINKLKLILFRTLYITEYLWIAIQNNLKSIILGYVFHCLCQLVYDCNVLVLL